MNERMSKEQARQNIKADFDKDAAVDLLCARIDQLEEEVERLKGLLEMAEFRADTAHKNWNVE